MARREEFKARDNQNSSGDRDAALERLAALSPIQYEHERKGAAKRLNVRAPILDRLVGAKRPTTDDGKQGRAISFPEPEPWPDSVDGAELLDGIAAAIRSHVVLAEHARDAATLWVVHAYLTDCFLVSPRLCVRSPTKGCGKTLLLDVLERLVLRSLKTANVTSSAIFRVVESYRPTLLVDEADTFVRDNDELRGVLNSGHRKGGTVLRTVGDDHEPRSFATYSACAIALIGALPETLHDRSVVVDLKRRLPSEKVEPFRPDRADHLDILARKAARWAADNAERIAAADPAMPAGIVNRAADNWRPLLAIAETAGSEWGERTRKAAEASRSAEGDDGSRLELLLGDIRDVSAGESEMPSADLVANLVALDGRPWAELGKSRKPLTQNRLARMLRPLGIAPRYIGPETARVRGYVLADFREALERYLPSEGGSKCAGVQNTDKVGTSEIFEVCSRQLGCTLVKCEKSNNDGLLHTCTVVKGGNGVKGHSDQEIAPDPTDPGPMPECLLRPAPQRCDHCGMMFGEMNPWDWPGRPDGIWLHPRCEEAWFDSEGRP
jgi:putative DNA primase/helicase